MQIRSRFWWWLSIAFLLVVVTPSLAIVSKSRAGAGVEALVAFGPRVAGMTATEQARDYLIAEYRKAGYTTEVGTFGYPKFRDTGSSLTVGDLRLDGRALSGSPSGQPKAPLVAIPSVGRPDDFSKVDAKGAIAIVRRGEIPFLEKVRNATAAGAVGVVIVNSTPSELFGTLSGEVKIPALGLSGDRGEPLLKKASTQQLQASLDVKTQNGTVAGYNVIAHLPNVKKPSVIFGGHYDSVVGSPGANDNASGTAVVLELARRNAKTPLSNSAWFIAFDGEEDGLHGSRAFVKAAGSEFLGNVKAMLNFDMVGINNKLFVGGTAQLTALAQKANPKISTMGDTGRSDHVSFAKAGVPFIFFYSGDDPNYHSPKDTKVDPKQLEATILGAESVASKLLESRFASLSGDVLPPKTASDTFEDLELAASKAEQHLCLHNYSS